MIAVEERTQSEVERFGASLRIENLHKRFGANPVLKGIDLEVRPGEFLAIVGRSGCGKSTLLRLVAGLETADQGGIALDAAPLRGLNHNTRIMFQDARLLPWQKVIDNVAIGLKRQERTSAEQALEQVGCETGLAIGLLFSRADSDREWRWHAPWSAVRACCYWTSLSAPWMR